jgi:hypothetical protein
MTTQTKKYILVNDYQCLCDPCSYDEALVTLNDDYDGSKDVRMIEYVAPVRPNIDYSVLDMY